jgi:DNA-binding NtrC family response regulator
MSLNALSHAANVAIEPVSRMAPIIPGEPRILIVCNENGLTERLRAIFLQIGLYSETAGGVTEACELAKSGRFQVIVTVPLMLDGSWRRLVDITKYYDLALEVVLLARDFDLKEWADALNEGAFDVINVLYELPNAAKVVTAAFWAVYLKGGGQLPQCLLKLQKSQNAA